MLHKQTVSPFLLETLKGLMKLEELNDFRLVGGTALALLLGHRESLDIDLFCPMYNEGSFLKTKLSKHFPNTEIRILSFGVTMYLKFPNSERELKVDIMSNEAFIRPLIIADSIRISSLEDIAAMKLEAITSRSEKKDYWDIAEILENYSFSQILSFYQERYPWNDLRGIIENISRFDKCEKQPDPLCLKGKSWLEIQNKILSSFSKYLEETKK